MTPTDSICEAKTNVSTKQTEKKSLCKKAYKSDRTNTVMSHAFPSTLISQRCFLRIWIVAKYILMDRNLALRETQIEF